MEEVTLKLRVETGDSTNELKKVKKSIVDVNDASVKTKKSNEELSEGIGALDRATGGAITKFGLFKGSLKSITSGFKTLRLAIISTGIGALLIAVTSLTAAFTSSEEGQNKFAKILGVIGALTGNLVDLLADLGEGIIKAFTNPIEVLQDFGKSIKTYITDEIKIITDGIGLLGDAIKKVFSGDFKGALEDASKGAKKLFIEANPTIQAIEGMANATSKFVKEQVKEANAAAKVADMRAKADKIERKLIVDRSKLESEIALLRLKSRQEEEFSAKERKQALLDAQELEEQLLGKETEFLELRRDAQVLENTFSRSNKENLDKEADAIAAVNRVVARRADAARSTQRELNRVSKEIERDEKEKAKQEQDRINAQIKKEKERQDTIQKIRDEYVKKREDKEADTELKKIELEEQRKLAELERLNATEQQKLEVRNYYDQLRDEARANQNKKELEETNKLNQQLAQSEDNLQKAKASAISGGLQVIGMLAGKSKGLAKTLLVVEKGLAIAQVITNAAKSIAKAKANLAATPAVIGVLPNPAFAIQAAATAKGIAATKISAAASIATITAQAIQGLGGGGASANVGIGGVGGGSVTPATPSVPPAFNIVGQSQTSQLAQTIAGQQNEPIKAYVVSDDVSTAQSLDRNIVEGASI